MPGPGPVSGRREGICFRQCWAGGRSVQVDLRYQCFLFLGEAAFLCVVTYTQHKIYHLDSTSAAQWHRSHSHCGGTATFRCSSPSKTEALSPQTLAHPCLPSPQQPAVCLYECDPSGASQECISLMANDGQHLFMCSAVICLSFLGSVFPYPLPILNYVVCVFIIML